MGANAFRSLRLDRLVVSEEAASAHTFWIERLKADYLRRVAHRQHANQSAPSASLHDGVTVMVLGQSVHWLGVPCSVITFSPKQSHDALANW